jgi:hypothetical protein
MAKGDDMMMYGAVLIGGLGFLYIFKDHIVGLFTTGQPVPTKVFPPPDDVIPDKPVIPQPTVPQLTVVEYKYGMDYYATRIAEEIDKNDIKEINRTTKLNIKGTVLLHYKSDLKAIVDAQNMTLGVGKTSLNEKSLRIFAQIVLKVCQRMGIVLKPEALARFTKQAAGKWVLAMKGLIVS